MALAKGSPNTKKKTRRTQHHEADVRLQAARADQEI
jgi:hypothetical protein